MNTPTKELATADLQRRVAAGTVQITSAEVDKAYIRERDMSDGVLITATGALLTAGMSYVLFTEVPLVLSFPLAAAGLAVTYVGGRILGGKLKQRRTRRKGRKDAI
jgi:hypothetical protein